jgi:hypothetical protein
VLPNWRKRNDKWGVAIKEGFLIRVTQFVILSHQVDSIENVWAVRFWTVAKNVLFIYPFALEINQKRINEHSTSLFVV